MTYDPEAKNKRVPIGDWLKYIGTSGPLLKGENKEMLGELEKEVERRWLILKRETLIICSGLYGKSATPKRRRIKVQTLWVVFWHGVIHTEQRHNETRVIFK
ncbi:hypothetical protein ABID47_004959 [Paenibacillus favisporus]|uniref:Uncharacterized protein n=1 Tax=Paenibacillus favisporus TaxID=221028 RepID=A0ABV2F998_9BACL|nr:hypothetical protein [Paenibacillus terrae]